MALSFPNSPSVGDVHEDSASGFSYQWSGEVWKSYKVEISGSLGGNLDADLGLNSNDITGTGDVDTTGNLKISGIATASSFVKSGGTSSQFLKADGSVDTSTYITSADGGNAATLDSLDSTQFLRSDAADTKTSGDLSFSDSIKATFGTGSDLQIFHDGSNSYIKESGTGNIIFEVTDATIEFKKGGSEHLAKFIPDGAVELYYDNSKKLETVSGGVKATGNIDLTSELNFTSASHKYIDFFTDNDSGSTYAANLRLVNNASNSFHSAIKMVRGGAVELYYDNSKKLETKSDGIDVTGEVQCDSLDVDGSAEFDDDILIKGNVGADGSTVLTSMTGRLRFDADYSDTARGPNKVQTYNDGSTWIAGLGVHSGTAAYYSGASHTWYKSSNQTTFTQTLALDGSGNLTAAGQISGVTVGGTMIATQAEAEAGTNNDQIMTPLRVAQAIAALGGGSSVINSIQRGVTSFNNNTVNATITSVTTTKAFISSSCAGNHVYFTTGSGIGGFSGSAYARLTSSTNVQVVAGGNIAASFGFAGAANSGTVSWEVIEFT